MTDSESLEGSPKRSWKGPEKIIPVNSDDILREMETLCSRKVQMPSAKLLIFQLGLVKDQEKINRIVTEQCQIAQGRRNFKFIREAKSYADNILTTECLKSLESIWGKSNQPIKKGNSCLSTDTGNDVFSSRDIRFLGNTVKSEPVDSFSVDSNVTPDEVIPNLLGDEDDMANDSLLNLEPKDLGGNHTTESISNDSRLDLEPKDLGGMHTTESSLDLEPNLLGGDERVETEINTSVPILDLEPQFLGEEEMVETEIKDSIDISSSQINETILPVKLESNILDEAMEVDMNNNINSNSNVIVISDDETSQDPQLLRDRTLRQRGPNTSVPNKGSKVRINDQSCPLSCGAFRNLRQHVEYHHLPKQFHQKNMNNSQMHNFRLESLFWLAEKIVSKRSIVKLYHYCQKTIWISKNVPITDEVKEWLELWKELENWDCPKHFQFNPINSWALVGHWRILLELIQTLSVEDRHQFRRNMPDTLEVTLTEGKRTVHSTNTDDAAVQLSTRSSTVQPISINTSTAPVQQVSSVPTNSEARDNNFSVQQEIPVPTKPKAMDSHFHLDRSLFKLNLNKFSSTQDLINVSVGSIPRNEVEVVGGIANFCDPKHFLGDYTHLGHGFSASVGIHPRNVSSIDSLPSILCKLDQQLKLANVVALGEVGLDHTEPEEKWENQEKVLVEVLSLVSIRTPVILHIRDQRDKEPGELYRRCLNLIKTSGNTARNQPFHLHCFTGTTETMRSWLSEFPNTYFGFTGMVWFFDNYQQAALQKVPQNRLLIETDSPYLKMSKAASMNNPKFIGDVAAEIAKCRNSTVKDICSMTMENTRRLYKL
ncbi:uncharacterized protein LOC128204145 [Mya arenaria]|uniref:uncharacterized protein LOC128204145 n=1 Tax=Mya arenaria TaxID=6604 RepID=UPI0022E088BB|nr:uncharacterized protein LOC128204145 [Mya arenaria]XP_052761474.1 uncharacterized protein LOC128204145 [Mya arenaria]